MKIYAPNIHLFAFQLYKGSNFEQNSLQDNEINFLWNNADRIVSTTLGKKDLNLSQRIDVTKEPDSLRVDLLKESEVKDEHYAVDFEEKISHGNTQKVLIQGFAHPLRIYDSYGLWINLRRPEKEDGTAPTEDVDIALLSQFNLDNCLILEKTPFFLGQTLLITAWLSAKDKNNASKIASECLAAIFDKNGNIPPFNRQGDLLGSPIFEYGLFSQLNTYQHILIWLFNNSKADEMFQQIYQELLDLFFFRTKVVKAFKDSRAIYDQLAKSSKEIEDITKKMIKIDITQVIKPEDLKFFKIQLKSLPQLALQYTRWLDSLEHYQNTIDIHQSNYSKKLEQIQSIVPKEDISFLENFVKKNSPSFQEQIKADLGYFKHGKTALEQAISSIRGLVEIEQTERDRSLEQTIQVLGVGLGAGAIASGVITQQINYINKPLGAISLNNPPHPFYASLFLSIVATLFFTSVAWLWTRRK